MGTIVTDGGRHIRAPENYLDEASDCLADAGTEQCLMVIRPGEYPGLRAAAIDVLSASFREKDGVEPDSYARHLAELEPQHFVLLIKRGMVGPIPVGAAQMAIHERRPPDSVRDIEAAFGVDVADLCAHTVTPSGRQLPNLAVDFRDVAGVEAIAVAPEYRSSRSAPYALLLYAQVIRYLAGRQTEFITAILDMRRGEVFTQLQAALRQPFNQYGRPIPPRVYWTEGPWAHLSNQEVPVDADGQPVLRVPNWSAPAYIELPSWLDRIGNGDMRDRMAHSRIVGTGLARYVSFDPSFERALASAA